MSMVVKSASVSSASGTPVGPFLVDLERFRGPMDLLLHLIRKQDIDIFDIPISHITSQFLAAIEGIRESDLDSAGEFLEMAATLVWIKAQVLLPRPDEEEDEDPRAELVRRLLEYEQIREVCGLLERLEGAWARRYAKGYVAPRPEARVEDLPLETTWEDVYRAAMGVEPPESRRTRHRVTARSVSMEEKTRLILGSLEGNRRIEFRKLVAPFREKLHGVMTLLAGLELSRRRRIRMRQSQPFHDLWVYLREEGAGDGVVPAPSTGDQPLESAEEGR